MSIQNKKAGFHYEILEKTVAGLSLYGAEVKSLRGGRGSLMGAFVIIRNGEAFDLPCSRQSFRTKSPALFVKNIINTLLTTQHRTVAKVSHSTE